MKILAAVNEWGFVLTFDMLKAIEVKTCPHDVKSFRTDSRLIEYVQGHPCGSDENPSLVIYDIPDDADSWRIIENSGREVPVFVIDNVIHLASPAKMPKKEPSPKHKYDVSVIKYGYITVYAENEKEAMDIVYNGEKLPISNDAVSYEDDWWTPGGWAMKEADEEEDI